MRNSIWARGGLLGRLVVLIIIVGAAASCGGDGSNSSEDATNSADGTGSGDEDPSDEGLAWVPFGPNDPDIPTPSWPAYNPFADGNCSALRDYLAGEGSGVGEFGRAMAAVCAAAVEGDQSQWEVAEAAFGAGDPSTLANDCLASAVSDLLRRAIAWHNRNPGETPDVQFNRVADTTECGQQDENADDADDETTDDETTDDETTDDEPTDDETESEDSTDDESPDETEAEDSTTEDETSQVDTPRRMIAA